MGRIGREAFIRHSLKMIGVSKARGSRGNVRMEGCGAVWTCAVLRVERVWVRARGMNVVAGHLVYANDDYSLRQEHKIRGKGGCSSVLNWQGRGDWQGRG
jgi:hypothetical protein